MKSTQIQEETLDGKPLFFSMEQQMGQDPTQTQGKVENGILHLKQVQYAKERLSEIPWPEGALLAWGAYLQTKDIQLAEGVKYDQLLFLPDISVFQGVRVSNEVIGREEIVWRDLKLNLWKTRSSTQIGAATMDIESWTDEQTAYRSLLPMGLMVIETVLSDSAEALSDFVASELMVDSLLEVKNIQEVATAQEVTYEIGVKGKDFSILKDLFVTDGNQTVLSGDKEGAVSLQVHPHRKMEQAEPTPGEEYLSSTFYLNYEDEAVQKLVMEVAELKKLPVAERAMALTEWVYESLEEKNFDTGFATASEVARNKQGDCTEHAVLLAALGRALEIPSRSAYGLALVAEENNKSGWMGFHMWTQFYVDGKWTDYDAALFLLAKAPVRLSMGTTSMQKDVLSDISIRVMQVLGLLDVKVAGAMK